MQPSNVAIVAAAQSWLAELDAWVDGHGLRGYDPFDIKQHGLLRWAQQYRPLRRGTTLACDLFPVAARRLLGVAPTENPKAYALVALGKLRYAELTGDGAYRDAARAALDWLAGAGTPDVPGLAWGYPFDVTARGLHTPKGTPVGVVCAVAGEAFLRAAEATGDAALLDRARDVGRYLAEGLPFLEQADGTGCFAYAATDGRRVHNANLLVAAFLRRLGAVTGEAIGAEKAARAEAFTLGRQREDGAWPYGEADPEPFEAGLMRLVDHHHTGFVLRALHDIDRAHPESAVKDTLKKGVRFYRTLFTSSGCPLTEAGRYPVDIHACAEGILCPSVLMADFPAMRGVAPKTLKWTYLNLRRPTDGAPWYRKYPLFRARLVAPRWGVAWVYWAVAEFLAHHQGAPAETETAPD